MCKYCDNFEVFIDTEEMVYSEDSPNNYPVRVRFERSYEKNYLTIEEDTASVAIRYCPFCGKKLVE